MIRLFVFFVLMGLAFYWFYQFLNSIASKTKIDGKLRPRPKSPNPDWVQVYETASWEEARRIQARLEEENLECMLYEQGKKDIHGNLLKGVGIAVARSGMSLAQKIISRIPV